MIQDNNGYRNYDINLSEVKASTYYQDADIKAKVDSIETAWNAFIVKGYTANAGASVMSIMDAFIDWAEHNTNPATNTAYFTGTSDTGGGYYLSKLNGLDWMDCGYMAGYMYSDDAAGYYWRAVNDHSSIPMVGADSYVFTSSTRIVWFYTVNYGNWF